MKPNSFIEQAQCERVKLRKKSLRLIWKISMLLGEDRFAQLVRYVVMLSKCTCS